MNIPLRFGLTVFKWEGIEKPESAAIQRSTLPEMQFFGDRQVGRD